MNLKKKQFLRLRKEPDESDEETREEEVSQMILKNNIKEKLSKSGVAIITFKKNEKNTISILHRTKTFQLTEKIFRRRK